MKENIVFFFQSAHWHINSIGTLLIGHFREEFNTYEADFFFRIIAT